MASWQLQEAKAKLSEVIATAKQQGPQIITQRGVQTAVVVPIDEWQRATGSLSYLGQSEQKQNEAFLKLLQSGPAFEIPVPPRGRARHRKPVVF